MSKVLAVGDLHTKTWIIGLVESVIDDYDAVVFCGDYADNWDAGALDTIGIWGHLRGLQIAYPDKIKLVLGNHDYAYLHPVGCSGHNDSAEIALSYPENRDLKDWLYTLPITLEIDGVTYSHAGIDERWDSEETPSNLWMDTSPLWVRPDWAQYKNIKQVVGHTPQETVTEVQPGIWCIDTFSQYRDGSPIGDGTMLAITDGKAFEKIKIHANHSNPSDLTAGLS